jgi:hypothetical protein
MSEVGERRKKLTIAALYHYIERLKKMEENEKDIILVSEQLQSDIIKERKNALEIVEHIEKSGFDIKHEVATSVFHEYSPMKNTLRCALLCYHNDLVDSLDIMSKRLHCIPDFPLLKDEIKFCKEFLNRMNEAYGLDTEVSAYE